eukprot:jgi/Ulvmu1/7576/UM037_0120.1
MIRDESVTGLNVTEAEVRAKLEDTCDLCVKAKHAADSHPASGPRATVPLELVHSDLMGPVRPASVGGNEYVMTAIDEYTGYAAVVPLKYKSEASEELKKVLLGWARQLERGVKTVRTD